MSSEETLPGARRASTDGATGRLAEFRPVAGDALLVGSVPAALLALFALPRPVRESLAMNYAEPTLATAFTSHFVHLSAAHLAANLLGYLLVVPLSYLFASLAGRRDRFRVAFLGLVVGLPFGLSLANVVFPRETLAVGASGLVMGFYGVLPLALVDYAAAWREWTVPDRYLPGVYFLGLGVIAALVAPSTRIGLAVSAGSFLLALAYGLMVVEDLGRRALSGAWLPDRPGFAEAGLAGCLLFLCYPLTAFGAASAPGVVVNAYSHLLGYSLGFIGTYLTCVLGPAGE